MTTIFTLHTGKAVVQVAAVEIPVNHTLEVGAVESIKPFILLLLTLDKDFKMILRAPIIIGRLLFPRLVNGDRRGRHDFPQGGKSCLPHNRTIILFIKDIPGCEASVGTLWAK